MIDWLTLKVPRENVSPEAWAILEGRAGRILKLSPDGEIEWQMPARESVRSDSHQVTVHAGAELVISGSPARVRALNNVFGSGDPRSCALSMLLFVERITDAKLPLFLEKWRCSRMDVTHNFALASASEVRQVLSYLRHAEGGRYQVRTAAETVYWSPQSRLRSGKAYHKGSHALYQHKKNQAEFTPEELDLTARLLRLELSLKSEWWRRTRTPWHRLKETDLDHIHLEYFQQFTARAEVKEMDNLLQQFERVALTKGQALAAYRTWSLIRAIGSAQARDSMPRATWMRHRKIMFDAGLTHADLHASNIVPFPVRVVQLRDPVRSWDELRRAA